MSVVDQIGRLERLGERLERSRRHRGIDDVRDCACTGVWRRDCSASAVAADCRNDDLNMCRSLIDDYDSIRRATTRPAAIQRLCTRFQNSAWYSAGEADQAVNRGAQRRDFAEPHSEQGRDQIETRDGNQAPVERADDDENGSDDIELFH